MTSAATSVPASGSGDQQPHQGTEAARRRRADGARVPDGSLLRREWLFLAHWPLWFLAGLREAWLPAGSGCGSSSGAGGSNDLMSAFDVVRPPASSGGRFRLSSMTASRLSMSPSTCRRPFLSCRQSQPAPAKPSDSDRVVRCRPDRAAPPGLSPRLQAAVAVRLGGLTSLIIAASSSRAARTASSRESATATVGVTSATPKPSNTETATRGRRTGKCLRTRYHRSRPS